MSRLKFSVALSPSAKAIRLQPDDPVSFIPMEAIEDGSGGIDGTRPEPLMTMRAGSYNYVADGDVLIAKVTPCFENGKKGKAVNLINGIGFATSEVYVLRPDVDRINPDFLLYVLSSEDFRFEGMQSMTGAGGLKRVSAEAVRNHRLKITSPHDQTAIARFLDQETGRIDGLIEKKTRFIALLREKRAAVITHAVTKGLNPNAPMKDGPFKALGRVPEHWDISPVGRALRLTKKTVGKRHDQFKLLSLTTRGVIERDISENFGKFPESFDTYQEVQPGNFVFCLFDIDETPRTVGLSTLQGMITGAYAVFDSLTPSYSGYLYYLFLHLDTCKGLKPFYTGLRKTIRPPKFAAIRIPYPPEDEALRIVAHIETQTSKIDHLIAKSERSIDLLREKRAALITAAVTGNIDVRNAA